MTVSTIASQYFGVVKSDRITYLPEDRTITSAKVDLKLTTEYITKLKHSARKWRMKLSTFTVDDKEAIVEIVRDLNFNKTVFRGQQAVSITPKKD